MKSIVKNFYDKMLTDERTSHFFNKIDMEKQRTMFCTMLGIAIEGPGKYSADDLRAAHKNLALNDNLFDLTLQKFGEAIDDHNIPPEVRQNILSVLDRTRDDILNR
ncbi:MAG: group 1 truncated hemoglobin [Rhodospirillales bacterium]|nr:group 1 truncated hemoglobin [Rhodospirillales bacterium]